MAKLPFKKKILTNKNIKEAAEKVGITPNQIKTIANGLNKHDVSQFTNKDFLSVSKLSQDFDIEKSFTSAPKRLFNKVKSFFHIGESDVAKQARQASRNTKNYSDIATGKQPPSNISKPQQQPQYTSGNKTVAGEMKKREFEKEIKNQQQQNNNAGTNTGAAKETSGASEPVGSIKMKDPIAKKDPNKPSKFQNFMQSDWPKVFVGSGVLLKAMSDAQKVTQSNGNKGRMSNAELYNQR